MPEFYNYYDYGIMEDMIEGVAEFILVVALIIAFVAILAGVVMFVLQAISLYTIAKRRGIHNPWLSWIPVGADWIMGCISDQYRYVAKGAVTNRRKILLGLAIASAVVSLLELCVSFSGATVGLMIGLEGMLSLIGKGLLITSLVFWYISMSDLYRSCDPNNHVLYLVLSIVFTITQPVFLLICRKKDGGMPPRRVAPVEPQPQEQPPVLEPEFEEGEVPVVEETPVVETEEVTEADFEETPAEEPAEEPKEENE